MKKSDRRKRCNYLLLEYSVRHYGTRGGRACRNASPEDQKRLERWRDEWMNYLRRVKRERIVP